LIFSFPISISISIILLQNIIKKALEDLQGFGVSNEVGLILGVYP
tara:strand:+ start:4495 stop:4629 length:135 start_codon:yes stop_codon:yes gene_type:complete